MDQISLCREYILRNLSESESDKFEEAFFSDECSIEHFFIAEDMLIEDYLDDNLSEKERIKLTELFSTSDLLNEKLNFIRSIKNYVDESNTFSESAERKSLLSLWKEVVGILRSLTKLRYSVVE
jgi:hypothetical protein